MLYETLKIKKTMTTFDNLSHIQKIRASLHRDVTNICKEACHFLGLEITKPAVDVVSELLFKKLSLYATDLEAFAKHAKRTTVNAEDVKLLVRRNPSLKSHLNKIVPNTTPKEKHRKSTLPIKQNEPSTSKMGQDNIDKEKAETEKKEKEQRDAEERAIEKLLDEQTKHMSVDDVIDLTF